MIFDVIVIVLVGVIVTSIIGYVTYTKITQVN